MIVAAVAAVGILVGSFTNVLIARVPTGEDWVRGASHCPKCGTPIAWFDNIPVFSWLRLRRRCRHCGLPISARYPLVELLVGALFVGVYLFAGLSVLALGLAYLAFITVALAFIDMDTRRLPDSLVFPAYAVVAAVLVVASVVSRDWGDLARGGAGIAVLGGYYLVVWLIYPTGMGFGDVKVAGLLGLVTGYLGWSSLIVAWIAGPLVGGAVVMGGLLSRRLTRKSKVAYGPALIVGAWVGIFFGESIAHAYVGLMR